MLGGETQDPDSTVVWVAMSGGSLYQQGKLQNLILLKFNICPLKLSSGLTPESQCDDKIDV